MSDVSQIAANNPDDYKFFAYVVDGEVGHVHIFQVHERSERIIACMQSQPTVVEITGDLRGQVNPSTGWRYDGINFIPPTE